MNGVVPPAQVPPELVFVYLGRNLPRYARASLRFAAKGYPGKTVLLTNCPTPPVSDPLFHVEHIDKWYDASQFAPFREKTTLDVHFRSGFWLHVVERFFVLRQYMEKNRLESLFHAELDVMVFDLSEVAVACDKHGSGIFAVMDDPSRALASLFYVNSGQHFDHFLSFVLAQSNMENEMKVIGSYLQKYPDRGHSLPSDRFFDDDVHPLSPSAVNNRLGLFDANALGQWLFGLDPRNVKLTVKNRFWNRMARFRIDRLHFRIAPFGRGLRVKMRRGEERQLRTLHVHSKIVPRLTFRPILIFYLWINRLPVRFTITRKRGWLEAQLLRLSLRGRTFQILDALNPVFGRQIGSLLLQTATRSPVPISARQRSLLLRLLPSIESFGPSTQEFPTLVLNQSAFSERDVAGHQALGGCTVSSSLGDSWTKLVTLEDLLHKIIDSPEEVVVVRAPACAVSTPLFIDRSGRQSLVVSAEKYDSEWPLVISQWGDGLDYSLAFSPLAQLIRPAWVRAMFPLGPGELSLWLASSPQISWQTFVQAYGAWARTYRSRSVFLVGQNSSLS